MPNVGNTAKLVVVGLLAVVLVLFLSACSSAPPQPTVAPATPTKAATEATKPAATTQAPTAVATQPPASTQGKPGGTLVVAQATDS